MIQAPYALSLLVCDSVIFERGTNKPTIVGCFSSIATFQFPIAHAGMMVFAEITDGRGAFPVSFQLVDADEENTLFSVSMMHEGNDPLAVIQLVFRAPPTLFLKPGEYRLQLRAGDEFLMERRIVLFQIEGQGHEPEQSDDGAGGAE
jgi:uncharacterized protein DUF6941